MARTPGEAGRDGANHVVTALLPKILDEMRTNRRLQSFAIILTLFGIVATVVFNHRPEQPPGIDVETPRNVDPGGGHTEEEKPDEKAPPKPDKADEATRIARAVSAAILFQQEGNIQAAIKEWRAVANAVDGTDNELGARAWFSVGYLHGKQSRFPEAIVAYDEAIRLNRGMEEAFINRGNAKYKLGRTEEAIADFSQAIQQNPDYTDAYFNRAQVRFILGYKDEARRDFERARALARAASDEAKADEVSREIERLFGGGDP